MTASSYGGSARGPRLGYSSLSAPTPARSPSAPPGTAAGPLSPPHSTTGASSSGPNPAARARRVVLQGARPLSEGAVACSPDGLTLAAAGDDRIVTLFRLDGSAPPARLGGHTDGIVSLAFSGDGRLLASGAEDHSVILWDVRRERQLGRRLLAHTQPVVSGGLTGAGYARAAPRRRAASGTPPSSRCPAEGSR